MAEFPALPLWTDAYLSDTRHLSTEQHGAYLLLLMEAWRRPSCSLPADDLVLARLAGMDAARWSEVRDVIMAFWKYDGRRKEWRQLRLDDEREYVTKKRGSQRDKARKRWDRSTKSDATAMPEGMPEAFPADAPTPTPTFRKREPKGSFPETKISGVMGSRTPSLKRKPRYTEAFEVVWKAYPTSKNMSKAEAFTAWSKLDDGDRGLVAQSIPSFIAHCKANPDYQPVYFDRYIRQRRFEGHAGDSGASVTENDWQRRIAWARTKRRWSTDEWGPMPGAPGCLAPSAMILPDDGVGWAEWKHSAAA